VSDVYSCLDAAERQTGFAEAKKAFARSGLVVMPTDTVYGIAADAFDPAGVRRLLRAKQRGRSMPTPVLIGARDTMRALTTRLSPQARELAEAFWPGGLTLICRQQPSLQWDLGDSRATVALRMPDQTDAIDLLLDNGPLAVSSANTTGQPPATTVEQAQGMLGEAIDIYLDAGATPGETPSTIVDCTGDVPRILRLGVIGLTDLQSVVPEVETPETTD
jgi:tRNA threonylcarbamoyl adenosine modification protein (Sua5/YciO/YrdC/YwlC family)